jgi:hypothetical protein
MNPSEALLTRHRAFWQRSPVDRPLLSLPGPAPLPPLQIPVPAGLRLPPEGYLTPDMLDPEAYHGQMIERWQGLGATDGDQFRVMTAYWHVPWLEAICGCPIWYVRDSGTMYAEQPPGGGDAVRSARPRPDNPWLRKLREFYSVLVELCRNEYPLGVVMPMRGPLDLLGALVGVEQMCFAFAESPRLIEETLAVLTDIWIAVVAEQIALLPPFEDGMASCEQYGLWAPGSTAVTQCDLAVAISVRTYERFLAPCDERICVSLDYPIMHLHSAGLHVLPPVLALSRLAAVQVVVDPGVHDPSVAALIPAFERVQAAGKPLIIHANTLTRHELDDLLHALSPNGLCIRATILDEP